MQIPSLKKVLLLRVFPYIFVSVDTYEYGYYTRILAVVYWFRAVARY